MSEVFPLEANKAIALRFLECAVTYDIAECMSLMSPHATWWVLGKSDRLKVAGTKSHDQIPRLLSGLSTLIPSPMDLSIKGVTAEGSRVAVEAECKGLWRDGAVYHNTYHFLFEIVDGLIVAVREYMDTLALYDIVSRNNEPH